MFASVPSSRNSAEPARAPKAPSALLAQPALVSVPAAFLVMVGVSLSDRTVLNPSAEMLALHAPEGLGLRLAEQDLDAVREITIAS